MRLPKSGGISPEKTACWNPDIGVGAMAALPAIEGSLLTDCSSGGTSK